MRKKKNGIWSWVFFFSALIAYVFLAFTDFNGFVKSLNFAGRIIIKIIPIFVFIWILMAFVDRFFSADFIVRHFPKGSVRGWLFAIITGIFSGGAIYLWYPLLLSLREKGFGNGIIACFLYNRAIKIYLLPLAIYYFGLKYVLVLTVVMALTSIVQGIIVEKITETE